MTNNLDESFSNYIESKSKKFWINDIGKKGRHLFVRDDYTFIPQQNNAEKYILFERLRREKIVGDIDNKKLLVGDIEYRISYHIFWRNEKWVSPRHNPLIPPIDFDKLLKSANLKGVLL